MASPNGWAGCSPEMFRGAEPTVEQDIPGPHGAEVLNASIDILTEYLRRTRLAVDPADVMIDVDLSDMSAMSPSTTPNAPSRQGARPRGPASTTSARCWSGKG